jgi:hypothetical protein
MDGLHEIAVACLERDVVDMARIGQMRACAPGGKTIQTIIVKTTNEIMTRLPMLRFIEPPMWMEVIFSKFV